MSEKSIDKLAPTRPKLARMERLAAFRVRGSDRAEFLQGQLSNDVSALQDWQAQLTSYSNPKGRVLAIMRLACIGDDWWLLLDESVAEAVIKRLQMFVLRSDVQFEADPGFNAMVIVGRGSEELATELRRRDGIALLEVPGALPRLEIFGHELPPVGEAIDNTEELRNWDSMSGLLQLDAAQSGKHVAQMLNLDRLGAIHFKKGCYAGQEIIARMHYLGKLKQRALPCFAASGDVGDAVVDSDGRKLGEILQSGASDGGRLHLAMLKLAALDGPLLLEDGSELSLLDTGLGHLDESTDASVNR